MGKVYRDTVVPIPAGAVCYSGKVFDGHGAGRNPCTVLIGYRKAETTMYPNENYKKLYFKDFAKYDSTGQPFLAATLYAGLYLLILAVAQKLGLYESIASTFGCVIANACMDYTMFLIAQKENATYLLPPFLSRKVSFTSSPLSKTWYSDYFGEEENEDRQQIVLDRHMKKCIEMGITSVYLCIDGCNVDCAAENNCLATKGDPKSGNKGATIVNFMWVVCAEGEYAGTPITYITNKGKFTDQKMVREAVVRLNEYHLKVKGIICDRGFCFTSVMKLLNAVGLPWVIMLTSNTLGYQTALEQFGTILTGFPTDYFVGEREFGIASSEKYQIFKEDETSAYVALLYKPEMAAKMGMNIVEQALDEYARITKNIKEGKRAAVAKEVKSYIEIHGSGKDRVVEFRQRLLEEDAALKGYAAIASSEALTAKEIVETYRLRQASERAYSAFKSQLGCNTLRVHDTISAKSKMFFEFIAAVIRTDIQLTCKQLKLDTNVMIENLDEVQYTLLNRAYKYSDVLSEPVCKLLNAYGVSETDMRGFEAEITRRYITLPDQGKSTTDIFSVFPWEPISSAKKAESSKEESKKEQAKSSESKIEQDVQEQEKPKRKRKPGGGRKKSNKPKPEPKKRGRKPGTRDSRPRVRRTKAQLAAALEQETQDKNPKKPQN